MGASKLILQAPGGISDFSIAAEMTGHECGKTNEKRSTLVVKQAPGGTSTICLGNDTRSGLSERPAVSANCFADGRNQNSGNTITNRSTTRLHQAPGGTATICLSHRDGAADDENVDRSNLAPEQGPSKSRGKMIMQLPGGNATIMLG